MNAPTPRQRAVLDYLAAFRARHQRAPTISDVATHFHFNRNAARGHLLALAKKRLVVREKGKHAAVELAANPDDRVVSCG